MPAKRRISGARAGTYRSSSDVDRQVASAPSVTTNQTQQMKVVPTSLADPNRGSLATSESGRRYYTGSITDPSRRAQEQQIGRDVARNERVLQGYDPVTQQSLTAEVRKRISPAPDAYRTATGAIRQNQALGETVRFRDTKYNKSANITQSQRDFLMREGDEIYARRNYPQQAFTSSVLLAQGKPVRKERETLQYITRPIYSIDVPQMQSIPSIQRIDYNKFHPLR